MTNHSQERRSDVAQPMAGLWKMLTLSQNKSLVVEPDLSDETPNLNKLASLKAMLVGNSA